MADRQSYQYTIGWICALPVEYAAATMMLDLTHEPPEHKNNDPTLYTLGQIHGHNVVIACLPAGGIGTTSAANVATHLCDRFPNVKCGLMVGIGGGVPIESDIRLGDVVVSQPSHGHGGVIQYDMGKRMPGDTFQHTSHLDKPPRLLLNAVAEVQMKHVLEQSSFDDYLAKLEVVPAFNRGQAGPDRLFLPTYQHAGGFDCSGCEQQKLVQRTIRTENASIHFHYGTIASANSVIKDAVERDRICRELGGNILCFEMEAAGLMNTFPCLVIRGICDYADYHKNKKWQPFAAATAAAYAKEILSVIPTKSVTELVPVKALWILPFNRNSQFCGRDDILAQLHQCLKGPENHGAVAIHGLGGCGKSAIAVEFAHQARENDASCAVFWVSSVTAERFQESYRDIARALAIIGADDPKMDILKLVQAELNSSDSGRWLMIVDNVDDGAVLFNSDDQGRRLYDLLPRNRNGMILFTTRSRKIAVDLAPDHTLSLTQLGSGEARDLLHKALKNQEGLENEEIVQTLLDILTHLPLAIVQAVAFMKKNNSSLQRYVHLLQGTHSSVAELLQQDFNDPSRAAESTNAVFLTWQISLQRIEEEDPTAAEYLFLAASIAPQNIPRSLFPPASSEIEREKAIGTLTAYAFMTERGESDMYDIHILVHHLIQDRLRKMDQWTDNALRTAKRLQYMIRDGRHQERARDCAMFLPHCRYTADIPDLQDTDDAIDLVEGVGHCYTALGNYKDAILLLRRGFDSRVAKVGGYMRLDTLLAMNSLVETLLQGGLYNDAEALAKESIQHTTNLLGPWHRTTLSSQEQLGTTYNFQGRWTEAEELHVQVLKTRQQVLGHCHSETVGSLGSLALMYAKQGRYTEAEALERRRLDIVRRWGDENEILSAKASLAMITSRQGRLEESEALEVEVVETQRRLLGPEHPDTLGEQLNLANILSEQGCLAESEALYIDVLRTSQRVLGPEHPHTLIVQINLASTLSRQGRLAESEALQVEVLKTQQRVLGPEHPNTLNVQVNLANTLAKQDRLAESEALEVEVLEMQRRLLGPEHPSTVVVQLNLATTLSRQGRLVESEALEAEVLETQRRFLGPDHPSTLDIQMSLANTLADQGRLAESEALMVEVLETQRRLLGPENPSTLDVQMSLAVTVSRQGRLVESEALMVEVLETQRRLLGPENPSTLDVQMRLATTLSRHGRCQDAEVLELDVVAARARVLGPEHPDTLEARINLTATYIRQRRWRLAGDYQLSSLDATKRVFGPDSPYALGAQHNIAIAYHQQHRWQEVEVLEVEEIRDLDLQVYDPEMPETLLCDENVAVTR